METNEADAPESMRIGRRESLDSLMPLPATDFIAHLLRLSCKTVVGLSRRNGKLSRIQTRDFIRVGRASVLMK